MGALYNVVWLLVLIGVMILIHELGHFWAARWFDVRVDVFSIGFGPRLFGFRRGETDYRFSGVLFGGYVKMAGDQPGEDGADDPRGLLAKPRWQRLIIAFAGPFMNIMLAVGLLTGLFMFNFQTLAEPDRRGVIAHVAKDSPAAKAGIQEGDRVAAIEGQENPNWEDIFLKQIASAYKPLRVTIERGTRRFETTVTPELDEKDGIGYAGWFGKSKIQIDKVSPSMPAEKAGLKPGDLLVSANNQPIDSRFKLTEIVSKNGGKPVQLRVDRKGQQIAVEITPVYSNMDGQARWMIGVQMEEKLDLVTKKLPLTEALAESVEQNAKSASLIFEVLRGILERRMTAKNLTGPIGMAPLAGEAASRGPSAFVSLMAMVSLNLAILNLLPIPILDGGVILLLLIEMLIGRDLSLPVKEAFIKVGFVFLMVAMVFVLYNDISRMLLPG